MGEAAYYDSKCRRCFYWKVTIYGAEPRCTVSTR